MVLFSISQAFLSAVLMRAGSDGLGDPGFNLWSHMRPARVVCSSRWRSNEQNLLNTKGGCRTSKGVPEDWGLVREVAIQAGMAGEGRRKDPNWRHRSCGLVLFYLHLLFCKTRLFSSAELVILPFNSWFVIVWSFTFLRSLVFSFLS